MTKTLGKEFFAASTFKGSWDVYLRQSKKACSILWSVWVFFAFLEKRRPEKYCLLEVNLVYHIQIFSLVCKSVNLFEKSSFKCYVGYNFVAPVIGFLDFLLHQVTQPMEDKRHHFTLLSSTTIKKISAILY